MLDLADDDAGGLEDPQMLGRRRRRKPGLLDEVAADAGVASQKRRDDLKSGRVCQGLGQLQPIRHLARPVAVEPNLDTLTMAMISYTSLFDE